MLKRIKIIFLQFLHFQWMGVSKTFKEESVHRTSVLMNMERLLGISWILEVPLVHWRVLLTQAAHQVPQFHDFSVFLTVFGYPSALHNFKSYFFPIPCQIAAPAVPSCLGSAFCSLSALTASWKSFFNSVWPYLILHKMSLRAFHGAAHGIPRA